MSGNGSGGAPATPSIHPADEENEEALRALIDALTKGA
jgi:hypothetical protein